MTKKRVEVVRLEQNAKLPQYAHAGDNGADLSSTIELTLKPFERALVPCGVSIALDEDHAGLVVPRSGLAVRHGISIVNAPGLIDSNYRGEIKVILINLDPKHDFHINVGDRIAQLVIVKAPQVTFNEVNELDITQRAENGFGSSGV